MEQLDYDRLDETTFTDLKAQVADHAKRVALSGGYKLDSEVPNIKEFFIDLNNRINIRELIQNAFYWTSHKGGVINTISKNKDKVYIDIANPQYTAKVAYVLNEPNLVVIGTYPIRGDQAYLVREAWDKEKVVRTFKFEGMEISADEFRTKTGLNLPEVWVHNLGVIPVEVIRNKTQRPDQFNPTATFGGFEVLSDTYPVRNLEAVVNETIKAKLMELQFGNTKHFGTFDPQTIRDIKQQGISNFFMSRVFLQTKQIGMPNSGKNIETSKAEFDKSLPHLDTSIDNDTKRFFDGSGYTSDAIIMGLQSPQTATQIVYANKKDIETTMDKRQNIIRSFLSLFDKCLLVAGLISEIPKKDEDRKYTFQINEPKAIMSRLEEVQLAQLEIEAGVRPREDVILDYNRMTEQQGQELLDKLKKQKEADMKDQQYLMEQANNASQEAQQQGDKEEN